MDLSFVVDELITRDKAGKNPKYKVKMKNDDGTTLTIVSDSKSIFTDFPKGDTVDVKIGKSQTTLV